MHKYACMHSACVQNENSKPKVPCRSAYADADDEDDGLLWRSWAVSMHRRCRLKSKLKLTGGDDDDDDDAAGDIYAGEQFYECCCT